MPVSAFASLLLVLGVALGLVGDALLNIRPWGLNVPPLVHAFGGGARGDLPVDSDSDELSAVDFLALTAATGFLLLEVQPRFSAPLDWAVSMLERLATMLWRGVDVVDAWSRTRISGSPEKKAKQMAVVRGSLIALPLLLVFGGLLVSADAAFEKIVTNMFDWQLNVESGVSHVLGFLGAA